MTEENRVFDIVSFIEEVLIWMDFEKIHSVMQHLNWCWKFSDTPPTIQEIKESCAQEVRRAYYLMIANKNLSLTTATGGWEVSLSRKHTHDTDVSVSVKFVVSEWNNYL